MPGDMTTYDREKAFQAMRECREQIRQGTAAMWLNAAYAFRRGASVYELADLAGVSVDVMRKQLRRVNGP
jgi:hypothetical protein